MLKVSTVNLSPDASQASATFDRREVGELDASQLIALLATFRGLDSVQNHEAEPQIIVAGKAGKFVVRTGQGKLFLYNARDQNASYLELTPEQIVARADEAGVEAAPEEQILLSTPKKRMPRGVAASLLIVGLLLNGYSIYSAYCTDSVNQLPPVQFVTDTAELAKMEKAIVGAYATGQDEGDRSIEIKAGGRVQFTEYGQDAETRFSNTDTYRIGQRDGKICLVTKASTLIEITSADTVTYFRDSYRRRP